ncbi:MAG: hypothetical protein JWR61_4085 [Ferruginibacter sp.]|nr:hypothetical protein [Ferruginibacter sp.]
MIFFCFVTKLKKVKLKSKNVKKCPLVSSSVVILFTPFEPFLNVILFFLRENLKRRLFFTLG